jgi:hypothetical protein
MDIIFHDHHATVPERTRDRAAAGARKCGARLGSAVDAVIRFEDDGPLRRAEIILHAARRREMVAKSAARSFDTALTGALGKLQHQIDTERRIDRSRAQLARRAARA